MIETKDFLLLLLGIAGGVVGNYLFKHFEQSKVSDQELERKLNSKVKDERSDAVRLCLITAAKWYVIANIFWVVSGAAWALEGAIRMDAVKVVLGASSVFAIFYFWVALRWVVKGIRGFKL